MGNSSVGTAQIVDDAVTNAKIASNAVDTTELAVGAVTHDQLADNTVDADHLQSNAVTTAKIADGAVNEAKFVDIASGRIMGRLASGSGDMTQLTATSVRSIINVADGATNSPTTTINNNADNRVITGSGTANTLEGEDKLTWNGNNLHVERTVTAYKQPLINIYNSGAYGWGGAIQFSANWSNTESHQAVIRTYGGSSANDASLAFEVGASGSEKLRILPSGGIAFNGDSAQANALDDYEEGTWSPVWGADGTAFSITWTQQVGYYIKIGKLVHCSATLTWTAKSGNNYNNTSALTLSLPFNAGNSVRTGVGHMGYNNALDFNGDSRGVHLGSSGAWCYFDRPSTGSGKHSGYVLTQNLSSSGHIRIAFTYQVG